MPADFTDPAAEEKAKQKAVDAERKRLEAEQAKVAKQAEADRKAAEADAERKRLEAEAGNKAPQPPAAAPAPADSVVLSKEAHDGILARLAAAESRLAGIQAPPPPKESNGPDGSHDLHKYNEGELVSRADGKTVFKYRYEKDAPDGRPHRLKNKTHTFHAANVAELRAHFDGGLLSDLERRERVLADRQAKKAAMIEDDDEADE